MAEEGKSLNEIFSYCHYIESKIASISLCVKSPNISTQEKCACFKGENELELGTGVHGELGDRRLKMTKLSEICKLLLTEINESERVCLKPEISVIVVVNNLGTYPKVEEMLFLREVVSQLQEMEIKICRAVCGTFFTCLDMSGLILTIVEVVDCGILQYLDATCETSGITE